MRDHRLPETENELRDWIVQAWTAGWRARRSLIGQPMGTIIHEESKRRAAFLESWDLPPEPKSPTVSVREALQSLTDKENE